MSSMIVVALLAAQSAFADRQPYPTCPVEYPDRSEARGVSPDGGYVVGKSKNTFVVPPCGFLEQHDPCHIPAEDICDDADCDEPDVCECRSGPWVFYRERGYLWFPDDSTISLDAYEFFDCSSAKINGPLPQQFESGANAVSLLGDRVVGYSKFVPVPSICDCDDDIHRPTTQVAVLWDSANNYVPVQLPGVLDVNCESGCSPQGGHCHTEAMDISSDGTVIVGVDYWLAETCSFGMPPIRKAVVWTLDADSGSWTAQALPTPDGSHPDNLVVSGDGTVIVGGVETDGDSDAYVWTKTPDGNGYESVILDSEPEGSHEALAVNCDGTVVTGHRKSGGKRIASLWHYNPSTDEWVYTSQLDDAIVDALGDERREVTAISADGTTVAGSYGISSNIEGHDAFIWSAQDGVQLIQDIVNYPPDIPSNWGERVAGISDDATVVVGTAGTGLIETNHVGWKTFLPGSEPDCLGDLNGDGQVDGADLTILLGNWGECPTPSDCPEPCLGDLNGDGVVNGADQLILLSQWGQCP